jgi:restriction endonuclease S subunit
MKVSIKKLAVVQMGFSFRSRLEASKKGNVGIIQMKDLSDNNTVNINTLTKINTDKLKEHHFAQTGDLIFRSRGLTLTSALLHDDPGKAVVAAPLIRIRIKNTHKILPEYLNWYISQPDAQAYFSSRAEGTTQKMISIPNIEELDVFIPTLQKQQIIVELASLAAREKMLLNELSQKRLQIISSQLIRFSKGETQ